MINFFAPCFDCIINNSHEIKTCVKPGNHCVSFNIILVSVVCIYCMYPCECVMCG